MKPVFVIVTREGCSWCTKFKNEHLVKTRESVKPLVEVVELNVSNQMEIDSFPIKGDRRASLFRRIRGVPYFCIITRDNWNSVSEDIEVIEFPAERYAGSLFPYSAENFVDWISKALNSDKILRIENNLKITERKTERVVKSSRGPDFIIIGKNS